MARRGVRLTDAQWATIEPHLPRLPRTRRGGRPWIGNRAVIDGILWVLKTGARWCDLPAEYPSPSTCWQVSTYPGEPHCFAFWSPPRAAPAALKAFQDTDTFFRRHLNTQPKPIDPTLIAHVPLSGQ